MTDLQFDTPFETADKASQPHVTPVAFVAALALALVLGLSAVDIQRTSVSTSDVPQAAHSKGELLDGRGKWGGYF